MSHHAIPLDTEAEKKHGLLVEISLSLSDAFCQNVDPLFQLISVTMGHQAIH